MNILLWTMMMGLPAMEAQREMTKCAEQLNRIHTIRTRTGEFMLYGDAALASYLQRLPGTQVNGPVIPVYYDEPFAVHESGRLVVSTGLLLSMGSEEDLRAALAQARRSPRWWQRFVPQPEPPEAVCAGARTLAGFAEHRARMARDIQRYKEWTAPRLKPRPMVAAAEDRTRLLPGEPVGSPAGDLGGMARGVERGGGRAGAPGPDALAAGSQK